MTRGILLALGVLVTLTGNRAIAADAERAELAKALRELDADVLPADQREQAARMVRDDLRKRLQAANDGSSKDWYKIDSLEAWERFRRRRLDALRKSLGQFPQPTRTLNVRVTGEVKGDGFRIENLVFESRSGLWVTANLYLPANPPQSMPGIMICHSHHRPKEHGELQDMGMTWARAGCAVLVMDQLGHGERGQHPFRTAADYNGEYRVSRQDYYFRYDSGIQLHLAGESLVGWMAWDMMRGIDLLLARPGIDRQRIALLGAVAGGGDPVAVTAALDERIQCAVPFNFGGPQPETRFPLPEDVEKTFNYAGSGSWESVRNLRLSARDGFLPWVIVGGIAPRRLIFAHEFRWDRERDPVWKRLQAIYKLYGAEDNLTYTHGSGELKGRPPEATHCTHIGRPHRVLIHAAFKKWFDINVDPEKDEYRSRRESRELMCMAAEIRSAIKPRKLHHLLTDLSADRIETSREQLSALPVNQRRDHLRASWARILGSMEYEKGVASAGDAEELTGGVTLRRIRIDQAGGVIAMLLLVPPRDEDARVPAVICVAQSGKATFLRHRADEIAKLLEGGVAVCLPDLRGIGETRAGNERGRYSNATSQSSTELMLGGTMVAQRLLDLQVVVHSLRGRGIDTKRIALWGDSFAETNPPDTDFNVPRRVDGRPRQSEPLGGLLAVLGAMHDDNVQAVYVRGGLSGYQSALDHWQVFMPHDVVIPDALTNGDLCDVAAAIAPRPLQLVGLVDGLNRRHSVAAVRKIYKPAIDAYKEAGKEDKLVIRTTPVSTAEWLIEQF